MAAFGTSRTIYTGSSVRDNGGAINTGAATTFHCSNVSGASATVRILILNFDASVIVNNSAVILNGRTRTSSTHGTVAFNEDAFLSTGSVIEQGLVSIESTHSDVFCTAIVVDAAAVAPVGNPIHLVRTNSHPGTEE